MYSTTLSNTILLNTPQITSGMKSSELVLSRLEFSFGFFFFLYHIYSFNANIQKGVRRIFLFFLLPQSLNQVQPNTKLFHLGVIPGAQCALQGINDHKFQHSKGDSGGHLREMPCPPSLSSASNEPPQHSQDEQRHKIQLLITVLT